MKHLLVDALSVNNLSGRHVLCGHLRQMAAELHGRWRFTVLTHRLNADLAETLPPGVGHEIAPIASGWPARAAWCLSRLGRVLRRLAVDCVFSPSGMLTPGAGVPQVVLAQNPWPMLAAGRGFRERLRLHLQRRAYAQAHHHAQLMVFNSRYMRDLYDRCFGTRVLQSIVAWQGIEERLFDREPEYMADARAERILVVSVMARHKAIEVIVRAYAQLLDKRPQLRLRLVGAWPDPGYRAEVQTLIRSLGVQAGVEFCGHIDADQLRREYAQARVFCLLSRCESFGIPAVEAQAAGTPVVVADGTAAPEIAGPGGIVVPADAVEAAASALESLLVDGNRWQVLARNARANAERFRWVRASRPLVEAMRGLAASP